MMKIKNPTLCQLTLYAPALLFFVVILLGIPMLEDNEKLGWLWLLLFIGSAVFSIYYLLRHMLMFIASDILFSTIRFWKKDRLWYSTERLGRDRQAAEKRLLSRAWGLILETARQETCNLTVLQRRSSTLMTNYRGIEQITMIYSIQALDEAGYSQIISSAKIALRNIQLDAKSFLLLDPKQKKRPVATATAVLILADSVSDGVTERVRSGISCSRGYMLPCVVDLTAGKCWFDNMGEAYMLGMTPKPEKNYAQDILRELLFGRWLPLKNAGPMLPFPVKDCNPDMTLMELLKKYEKAMNLNLLGFLKLREKWITRKMKHGDTMLHKGKMYCKLHKRVAELWVQTDLNDPGNIRIALPERWCLPKQSQTSKEDRQRIQKQAETWLTGQGYRVFIAPETQK